MRRLLNLHALADCDPRRICVIKPSALGDVVQSLPVLEGLRARWPDASICWVIRDDLAELVDRHPLIDDWMPYERRRGMRAFVRLLRRLHSADFDLVIDLQGLARSALMAAATGAPIRVGLETSRDAAYLSQNIVLPDSGRDTPAHARYRRVVEAIGAGDPGWTATIPMTSAARRDAAQGLSSLPRPVLAVHPGATWTSKRWPIGRFAAVMGRAVRAWRASVVVVGGAEEVTISRRFTASVRAAASGVMVHDVTGKTSIGQLAAVLELADLLLTNDSGPMHLAAAVGTPVVGVFTSTSPILSGPPATAAVTGPRHQLVATSVACANCYKRRCPLSSAHTYACQRDLSVDYVWQAVQRCVRQNCLLRSESATQPAGRERAPLPAGQGPIPIAPQGG